MAQAQTLTPDQDIPEKLQTLMSDNEAAWNALATVRETWYDKEKLLVGRLADQFSKTNARARVSDAMLSTLAWERQMRVCSQLPSGTIFTLKGGDDSSAALMNEVFFKYVIPNADSQFEALTKLRMSGVYASVYGVQFMLYDYRIDDGGYIGPDFWLLPARNVMPQPGRNSINDCAWVDVSSVQNINYVDGIIARKSTKWNLKNLKTLKSLVKAGAVPARELDSNKKSAVESGNQTSSSPVGSSTGRVELITRYERGKDGHWITWAPDYPQAGILRDIPNPHKSGKIPIVARYCYPLLDSIFGLGDFERGMTLQKAKDSLINLYLEAVKMSIFPPLKIDVNLVTPSTINWEGGSKWLVSDMNGVQAMETNPMGVQTFQNTSEYLSNALMNQFGTTQVNDTSGENSNPLFGSSDGDIAAQNQKETARDNWDRYMVEQAVQELYEGMANLLATNQEKPINFHLHDEDLEAIRGQYMEDDDDGNSKLSKQGKMIFSTVGTDKRSAKLTVTKSMLPDQVSFFVDPNSTLKENEEGQVQSLKDIMGFYMTNPQMVDQLLGADNMKFNFGKAFKQYVYNSGVTDPDDIITDIAKQQESQAQSGNTQAQQPQPSIGAQQQMAQVQGATPQPQFQDPDIAAAAQMITQGAANGQPASVPQPGQPQPGQPTMSPTQQPLQVANTPAPTAGSGVTN